MLGVLALWNALGPGFWPNGAGPGSLRRCFGGFCFLPVDSSTLDGKVRWVKSDKDSFILYNCEIEVLTLTLRGLLMRSSREGILGLCTHSAHQSTSYRKGQSRHFVIYLGT